MSGPISRLIPPPPSPPWWPCVCSLCLCLYFCFVNRLISTSFLDSTFKWYCVILSVSLSDWLHSIWQVLGPSTSLQMALFLSFYGWVMFHCVVFPGRTVEKSPAANTGDGKRCGFNPWVGKIPWRRKWQPTPEFLPGKSHGQRSLVGSSPWGRTESHMAGWLSTAHTAFRGAHTVFRIHVGRTRLADWAQHTRYSVYTWCICTMSWSIPLLTDI